jgi:hypothetical protein
MFSTISLAGDRFDKPFDYFLTPVPKTAYVVPKDTSSNFLKISKSPDNTTVNNYSACWVFKPEIVIPAFCLQKSLHTNSMVDISLFTGTGGGVTYQRNELRDSINYATCSIAAAIFLTRSDSSTNVTPSLLFGCLNNVIMLGCGYNLGDISNERRFMVLLSIGINLTN